MLVADGSTGIASLVCAGVSGSRKRMKAKANFFLLWFKLGLDFRWSRVWMLDPNYGPAMSLIVFLGGRVDMI